MLNNDKYHVVVLGCDEGIGEAILGISVTTRDRRCKACRFYKKRIFLLISDKRNQVSNIEGVEE